MLPESKRPGTFNCEIIVYVEALFSSADMLYPCQSIISSNKGSSTFTAAYLKLHLNMLLSLLQLHIQCVEQPLEWFIAFCTMSMKSL